MKAKKLSEIKHSFLVCCFWNNAAVAQKYSIQAGFGLGLIYISSPLWKDTGI